MAKIERGSVFLGFCSGGQVETAFMFSVLGLWAWDLEHNAVTCGLTHEGGLYIDCNRDRVGRKFFALEDKPPWLLMMDSDVQFQPDALNRLLEVADPETRPIVSALYISYVANSHEYHQPVPVWMTQKPDGEMTYVINRLHGNEMHELSAVGMGFCLIHRSVFEKIAAAYDITDDFCFFGRDIIKYEGRNVRAGEDITFCLRARKAGCSVWGYSGVCINHIKKRIENVETMLRGDQVKKLKLPPDQIGVPLTSFPVEDSNLAKPEATGR